MLDMLTICNPSIPLTVVQHLQLRQLHHKCNKVSVLYSATFSVAVSNILQYSLHHQIRNLVQKWLNEEEH